jgi:hypothetical protein
MKRIAPNVNSFVVTFRVFPFFLFADDFDVKTQKCNPFAPLSRRKEQRDYTLQLLQSISSH